MLFEGSFVRGSPSFNTYVIEKRLGSGSSGEVFKAREVTFNKDFAIKVISSNSMDEIEITKFLVQQDFKHVVKYIEWFQSIDDEKISFIVMELCNKGSIFSKVLNFTQEEIIDIILQVSQGIQELHSFGIIHRDIKPENILSHLDDTTKKITYKICDLGISKKSEVAYTKQIGTSYYVAPEVQLGEYGIEVDIWSLGLVLYELLSQIIFDNDQIIKEIRQKIENKSLKIKASGGFPQLEKEFYELLKGMVRNDPKERSTLIFIKDKLTQMQNLCKNQNYKNIPPENQDQRVIQQKSDFQYDLKKFISLPKLTQILSSFLQEQDIKDLQKKLYPNNSQFSQKDQISELLDSKKKLIIKELNQN